MKNRIIWAFAAYLSGVSSAVCIYAVSHDRNYFMAFVLLMLAIFLFMIACGEDNNEA